MSSPPRTSRSASSTIFDAAIERLRQDIGSRQAPKFNAGEVLRSIAQPRLVGTAGWLRVRDIIHDRFVRLGYETRELRFGMSTIPGRFALSAVGALIALGSMLGAAFLLAGRAGFALIALVGAGELVAIIALVMWRASLRMKSGRVIGKNMLFQKPGARPRWILVAHYDSKSQLVPLLLRAPAGFLAGIAWLFLLAQSLLAMAVPIGATAPFAAGITGMIAGSLLALSWSDNDSPGALDNASGVATLVGVAERERDNADVAFLLTDAEELGLAGARAVTPALAYAEGAINVDGVDDHGRFRIFERFGIPRAGLAPHLARALLGAAAAHDLPIQRRDVPLGLLLDHMPIVRAGIPAVTLARGSARTLARIHRPEDDLSRLTGEGVALAVELISTSLAILRAGPAGDSQETLATADNSL
jgi:hypothetical protein